MELKSRADSMVAGSAETLPGTGALREENLRLVAEAEALRLTRDELKAALREKGRELTEANAALQAEIGRRRRLCGVLRRERRRLFSLLDALPFYVLLRGGDCSIRFANRYFLELLGKPLDRDQRSLSRECLEHCEGCPSRMVLRAWQPLEMDWVVPMIGRAFRVYASPFFDVDGSRMVMEIGMDVTGYKRIEAGLKKYARKLEWSHRELREFATVATHDLQVPLRKIRSFGERLFEQYGQVLPPEGQDFLGRMALAARRLQGVISSLVAYVHQTGTVEPFRSVDLDRLAREVAEEMDSLVETTGAAIEINGLPVIEADAGQMRRLFQHLMGNAIKFRGERPPVVRIKGAMLGPAPGEGGLLDEELCQISVEDNGVGFDEQYLDRILSPFSRLQGVEECGIGLGLTVCRRIIERHGGHIMARSAPGQGATFIITLPVKQWGVAFKTA